LSLCDLHYHLNIFGKKGDRLRKILRRHRGSIAAAGLRFLASTEHVYKNPLECYQLLSEVTADSLLTVIPGVEWISRENVELIFLFDSEEALRSALGTLRTFSHSVWEAGRLREDLGAVLVIPHPFTPGVTGAVGNLGLDGFEKIMDMADYVEIHNGLAHQFRELYLYSHLGPYFARHSRKVEHTDQLPLRYRRPDIGWSVGSDAHFPGEIYSVGRHGDMEGDDWFSVLKRRLHFEQAEVLAQEPFQCRLRRNIASIGSVFKEAMIKKRIRYFGPKDKP
jgi:hypothetical protein